MIRTNIQEKIMNDQILLTDKEKITQETREGYMEFFDKFNADFFATLTFSKEVTGKKSFNVLWKFIVVLDKAIFGSRSKRSVSMIPVHECVSAQMHHFHILIKNPFMQIAPERREKLLLKFGIDADQIEPCEHHELDLCLDRLLM